MDVKYQVYGENMEEIDLILADLKRTHVIVNSEAGHGKSESVKTIIKRLKEVEPKTIVKVFDVSQSWYWNSPLKYRQKITVEKLVNNSFLNINNSIYEMGNLTEEHRRYFTALIIHQDYQSRKDTAYEYGLKTIKDLPRIVYIFEESDTYFDSSSLNKKDHVSSVLRDFIKVGRNFGLRSICITTASVGELGTKLRRRSKHLIGRIISDSDYREYNRMSRNKTRKGDPRLGDLALNLPRFHWIYFNGVISEPFRIYDEVDSVPVDFVQETVEPVVDTEPEPLKKKGFWSRLFS